MIQQETHSVYAEVKQAKKKFKKFMAWVAKNADMKTLRKCSKRIT